MGGPKLAMDFPSGPRPGQDEDVLIIWVLHCMYNWLPASLTGCSFREQTPSCSLPYTLCQACVPPPSILHFHCPVHLRESTRLMTKTYQLSCRRHRLFRKDIRFALGPYCPFRFFFPPLDYHIGPIHLFKKKD
jgi:hypothetical protein